MLNQDQKLNQKLFEEDVEKVPLRQGYGEGLLEAGKEDENIVALCADLTGSTKTKIFADEFPERFIQVGIGEQSMASVASGMAAMGKIPFIASYAMFSPGRNWEQIRTTVCYNDSNVKIAGCHAGVSVGPDGGTHQAIEDITIMRVLPRMTVVAPCDSIEAKKATMAGLKMKGPFYIRLAREGTPIITTGDTSFEIGKAQIFWSPEGDPDVSVFACGSLVHNAIVAAKKAEEEEGIKVEVVNNHTIKPIDEKTIIESAKRAGAVVTVEEHQVKGGMGSAVAEVLVKNNPVPMEFVGVNDRFGESGEPEELIEKFELGVDGILKAIKKVKERK